MHRTSCSPSANLLSLSTALSLATGSIAMIAPLALGEDGSKKTASASVFFAFGDDFG